MSAVALPTLAVAVTPFSLTVVAPAAGSKAVPTTETEIPDAPLAGVKLVRVGAPAIVTVKLCALVAVTPATVTVTRPVVAPDGTLVAIDPESEAVTGAVVPLNWTALFAGVALKPDP
ncbi:MAG TPA: hypothetical protein VF921_15595 [Vicinamibacterales bacterium]